MQIIQIDQKNNQNVGNVEQKLKKIVQVFISINLISYFQYLFYYLYGNQKDMKKLSNYGITEFKIIIKMKSFIIKKLKLYQQYNYNTNIEMLERNEEMLECWDQGIQINPNNVEFYKEKCYALQLYYIYSLILMKFDKFEVVNKSWVSGQEDSNHSQNQLSDNEENSPLINQHNKILQNNQKMQKKLLNVGIQDYQIILIFQNFITKKVDKILLLFKFNYYQLINKQFNHIKIGKNKRSSYLQRVRYLKQ